MFHSQANRGLLLRRIDQASAITLLAAVAIGSNGCHKSDADRLQGTWVVDTAELAKLKDRPNVNFSAMEFAEQGKVIVTPHAWGIDRQEQATYDLPGPGQLRLTAKDGHILNLRMSYQEDDLMLAPADDARENIPFRQLKKGETVASYLKSVEEAEAAEQKVERDTLTARQAVEAKENQARYEQQLADQKSANDQRQKQIADQQAEAKASADAKVAADAKREADHKAALVALMHAPGLVLAPAERDSTALGFALDPTPVDPSAPQKATPPTNRPQPITAAFTGICYRATDDFARGGPVTIADFNGGFMINFDHALPGTGDPVFGDGAWRSMFQVGGTDTAPVPTGEMQFGGAYTQVTLRSDPALHDKIEAQYKTTLAKIARNTAVLWWLDDNGSRLSDEQRAQVKSTNAQVEAKYGPLNQLRPDQRKARQHELDDLLAAVITPPQMADQADCQAILNLSQTILNGNWRSNFPRDQNAMIDAVLVAQGTPDVSVFCTPADAAKVPADVKAGLIGQRRDWVRSHIDFDYLGGGLHYTQPNTTPPLLFLAERAGVSATGDRAVIYTDGRMALLPEADVQKAIDAQSHLFPAAPGTPAASALPDTAAANSIGMSMVPVKPGSFTMVAVDPQHPQPQSHKVTLDRGFLISATPVTHKQWLTVMGEPAGQTAPPADDAVLESMTWDEANQFCLKLSATEGKHYRLPTDAESAFVAQTSADGTPAPADAVRAPASGGRNGRRGTPAPPQTVAATADQLPANSRGIRGLSGTPFHFWCSDKAALPGTDPQTDPCNRTGGSAYIIRGGADNGQTMRAGANGDQRVSTLALFVVIDPS